MSSDLLQQAMIDAAALKEAAMKNAENALIEKYSVEFNQTVQKLLEQEDPAAAAPPADANAAPPMDPTAALGGDVAELAPEKADAFKNVPGAFSGDDDEVITINFDQIKATLNEMMGVKEAYDTKQQDPTPDALAAGKASPDLVVKVGSKNSVVEEENVVKVAIGAGNSAEESELELELDEEGGMVGSEETDEGAMGLEEVELEEGSADAAVAQAEADAAKSAEKLGKAKAQKALEDAKAAEEQAKLAASKQPGSMSPTPVAESIEFSEEELQELAEELKVDIKVGNLSDGYMGSTETQKREQRNLELAAARDDKAAAEREEEMKKMGDLVKENTELKNLNTDALDALAALKEQVEKLNVLNAKLLYTNKALVNISLNERQKNNIVESISKADSVLAAKTIYETVQNAVENKQEREAPQSLRETLNRAATPFVVKKSANNSVNDLMAARMKALAGIK